MICQKCAGHKIIGDGSQCFRCNGTGEDPVGIEWTLEDVVSHMVNKFDYKKQKVEAYPNSSLDKHMEKEELFQMAYDNMILLSHKMKNK